MKKTVLLLLCIFAAAGVIFGGGSQAGREVPAASGAYRRDPNLNAPGTFPIVKQKVAFKIGVGQSSVVEDWETNWMTQQIEKNGNFDLTFELYAAGEMPQKVELQVMAGGTDLPDILWYGPGLGRAAKYGQAGMIVPVTPYYRNTAHYYNIAKKDFNIDLLKYVTSYDGNIWGMFGLIGAINNEYSANWLMIYEPWLTKLGLKMPDTIEDFVNILRAFRDRDPNGNGQKDEIPLLGDKGTTLANMLNTLMNPFIYSGTNFWMWDNGKIDVAFNKAGWREGLRYAKRLFDEGLISPLSFTQDATQMTALITPDPPVVGAFARISASNLPMTDRKRQEYVIQQPLTGPAGKQSAWSPTLPSIRMLITKNCKNPEAAFAMGDYMYSEEMSVGTRWGEKGVDWVEPAPGEKSCFDSIGFPATLKAISPWGVMQNKWYAQVGPFMTPEKWANGLVPTAADHTVPLGRSIEPVIKAAKPNPIVGLVYSEQEQETIDEFHTVILDYVKESYARFVTGDLSIDRDWDSYVAEFNRMGLADVIKATQGAWDRMNK
jgi:putative aldouronate transport system substrate-binding protein